LLETLVVQTRHQVPVLNRIARYRGRRGLAYRRGKAANVDLLGPGNVDFVIAIAGHEMVLGTEIVVDARHVEVAGDRRIKGARKS